MSVASVTQLSPHSATLIFNMTTVLSSGLAEAGNMSGMTTGMSSGSTVTSTNDVTVALDRDDLAFIASWYSSALSSGTTECPNLRVKAGDRWRNDIGAFDLQIAPDSSGTAGAQVRKWLIGPFESARFAEQATSTSIAETKIGAHYITFSLTTAYSTHSTVVRHGKINIVPFRMPRVDYDT